MSVIEKNRIDQNSKTKPARPKQYQVVYHYNLPKICRCSISVISEVFHLSLFKAHFHVASARDKGKETVFVGAKDEVETKTSEANLARGWHNDQCGPVIMRTEFKCEPV